MEILGRNGTTTKIDTSDKPCSINDEPGICVFTAECVKRKGIVLGTCRDGFLFGACCSTKIASSQADLMPHKADPQVILNKIDMLIDKLKPKVKVNSSTTNSSVSSNTNISDSLSSKNTTKLLLAQVDHGNIDSMMHSIVENVLENFDTKLPFLLNEVNSPSDSLKNSNNNSSVNVVIVGLNDAGLNSVYTDHSQSSKPTESSSNTYHIQASDSTSVILGGSNSLSKVVVKSTTKSTTTSKITSTTTPKTTTATTTTTTTTTTTKTTTPITTTTTTTQHPNKWDYKRGNSIQNY